MIDCHMAKEIIEQPALFRTNAARWAAAADTASQALHERPTVVLIGRGSSGHACTFASYLMALHRGRYPIEFRPWICTQPIAVDRAWDDAVVFAYSSSGQSTDVAYAALWLKNRGAHVVAITNAAGESNLSRASDRVLALDVGEERAVPATKTFNAQLILTAALCGLPIAPAIESIARSMEMLLSSDAAKKIASFIEDARAVVWIARGPALAAAQDASLKIQEAAGYLSQAWSTAEMLHGPIGAMSPRDRVVLLEDSDPPFESADAVSTRLLARGTPHLSVADTRSEATDRRPHAHAELSVRIPLPEVRWARTVVFAFLAQLVTLELAERAGLNPDQPSGLSKVTLT